MRFFIIACLIFFNSNILAINAPKWGPTGHRVVGEIAEKHLTKKAKRRIEKILNGHGLAYVSNYADEIKSDRKYDKYKPWHYVNYPFDSNYSESNKSDEGDIIVAIETCIGKLKNEKTSMEEQAFYLKLLIHFVGDLHQPLHIGIEEDKGGNDFQVRWFSNGSNLHRVWDSDMIDSYKMSYTEMAQNIQEGYEFQNISVSGSITNWADEVHRFTKTLYNNINIGDKLGYNYSYENFNKVQSQLNMAGVRLAKLLNDIYG